MLQNSHYACLSVRKPGLVYKNTNNGLVPDSIPKALLVIFSLFLTSVLSDKNDYYPHFMNEETESQRG